MGNLGQTLSQYWSKIQGTLFPQLQEELDPLTEKQQQLITILELIRVEQFVYDAFGCAGRPPKTRTAIARSFVAKMVYNMPSTTVLWERLHTDKNLRRICGWEHRKQIPSESTFSRAYAEFAELALPQRAHEELIKKVYGESETIVIHNSRDATAIHGRERPTAKEMQNAASQENTKSKRKRGRPKKEEIVSPKEPTRIEKQSKMTLEEMLKDLPSQCDIGMKKNSKGYAECWIGYKLHLDIADGCIPISAILTSASVHDSQVAIPLATMTNNRVINLYDIMDAAYDVAGILDYSRSLGHVPLVDKNPRRNTELAKEIEAESKRQKHINWCPPEKIRYNERTTAERANARLKDDFGARSIKVRGHTKVMCHLMFGIIALAADQIMKLII
jgi:hypothetical protein